MVKVVFVKLSWFLKLCDRKQPWRGGVVVYACGVKGREIESRQSIRLKIYKETRKSSKVNI
jgi:hypothetical protein